MNIPTLRKMTPLDHIRASWEFFIAVAVWSYTGGAMWAVVMLGLDTGMSAQAYWAHWALFVLSMPAIAWGNRKSERRIGEFFDRQIGRAGRTAK